MEKIVEKNRKCENLQSAIERISRESHVAFAVFAFMGETGSTEQLAHLCQKSLISLKYLLVNFLKS